ncbi:MAG: hypothetical protein QXO86_01435 [Nitrososphaerota archaeon]
MSRSKDTFVRAGYQKTKLHKGERTAKARGIVGYRMKEVKPGTYIRLAITKRSGKEGGRTVAVSKLKKKRT